MALSSSTVGAHLNADVPPESQALDQLAVLLQLLQLLQDLLFLLLAQLLLGLQHREQSYCNKERRKPQLRRDAKIRGPLVMRLGRTKANAARRKTLVLRQGRTKAAAAARRKNGQALRPQRTYLEEDDVLQTRLVGGSHCSGLVERGQDSIQLAMISKRRRQLSCTQVLTIL